MERNKIKIEFYKIGENMIIRKEKYYLKKINKIGKTIYDVQERKRTTYLLFGIIPIFINDEVISGKYEK